MVSKKINEYSVKMIKTIWSRLLFSAQLFCMLIFVLPTFLYTYRYSSGIKNITESVLPSASATLVLCKYILLFYKRKDVSALLQDLQIEWDRYVLKTRHPDENVMNANKYSQRIAIGYASLMLSASASVVLAPYIIMSFERIFGDSDAKLILPLKADFILDTSEEPTYTIICLLLIFSCFTSALANSGGDCLFIGTSLHVVAHIRSLRDMLKNIGKIRKISEKCDDPACEICAYYHSGLKDKKADRKYKKKASQSEEYIPEAVAFDQLKQCVIRHNEMIEYVEKLETIFSHQSMLQFLSSSLTMCLILFQIVCNRADSRKVFTFGLYLTSSVLQLYMFAWYGQQLLNETLMIADAAYDCPWYNYSPRFRKSLLLVILRAQRPSGISASNFYYISVESFAKIINTAASYFTLLNSFKNK